MECARARFPFVVFVAVAGDAATIYIFSPLSFSPLSTVYIHIYSVLACQPYALKIDYYILFCRLFVSNFYSYFFVSFLFQRILSIILLVTHFALSLSLSHMCVCVDQPNFITSGGTSLVKNRKIWNLFCVIFYEFMEIMWLMNIRSVGI